MRKRFYETTWFSWAWKIVSGLAVASTVAATWWMFMTFETKVDAGKFKERYWNNRREDVKQVIDIDKRVDRLESKEQDRRRRNN